MGYRAVLGDLENRTALPLQDIKSRYFIRPSCNLLTILTDISLVSAFSIFVSQGAATRVTCSTYTDIVSTWWESRNWMNSPL